MIHGGIEVHTRQLQQNGIGRQVLKDGSQVLVRIISDKGNGRYEGSVAGARVSISSQKNLKPGSVFTAVIESKNGQIVITPNDKNLLVNMEKSFELQLLQNEKLFSFINNTGLPPDELSKHLLQQMKQLGMKFDGTLFNKLYNSAVKFKGKEKKAIELLMILAKKNINFSEEELLELISELYNGEDFDSSENKDTENEYNLLNKINKKPKDWQLLPYSIINKNVSDDGKIEDKELANGSIKILFDDEKRIKLLNIDCFWNENQHEYLFSLEYEKGLCKKILVNTNSIKNDLAKELLNRFINRNGKNISIEWTEKENIEGTACASEELFTFGGEV